ncbi:MAG: DASH family cryptochrome [Pseudoalteromonas sp.]
MTHSIYWFTNDLRLSDNALLKRACEQSSSISFIYCIDPDWFRGNRFNCQALGEQRWAFLVKSLHELNNQLNAHDQYLIVYFKSPLEVIDHYYSHHNTRLLYCSEQIGLNERRTLASITTKYTNLTLIQGNTFTLYSNHQLPFELTELPLTFSQFRKKIESSSLLIKPAVEKPSHFPAPLIAAVPWAKTLPNVKEVSPEFNAGELAAKRHITQYFSSLAPSEYKLTRNALDGIANSTKFSPWLANGNISVRQIMHALGEYEQQHGANESTYWIYFELLWREYFQLYSLRFGSKLFAFDGIASTSPLTSFYPGRFKQWCTGTTAYPIVNACMKQLNQTGYMSNRGRQIVASCLVNELSVDWRFGAAYFEQQLIDYDVAANWGNWQYLAGAGADPRSGRHFNLVKQTHTYDPEHRFIKHWRGGDVYSIDSADAADWPLSSY